MTTFDRLLAAISFLLLATTSVHAFGETETVNASATNANATRASLSDLQITITQVGSDPPSLEATVHNTSPSTAYTILKWDSPLDVHALLTGVFKVVDLDTGEVVRGTSAKPRRIVPPPRKSLIEIWPGESKVQSFVITEPGMRLKADGRYQILVRGTWKAVWPGAKADVTAKELKQSGRGKRALSAGFKSNNITIEM